MEHFFISQGFKNRRHSADNDLRVVHGSHVGGVENNHQWDLTLLGRWRKFHGLNKFRAEDVAARYSDLYVQTVQEKTNCHGRGRSHHLQEQTSSVHRLHWGRDRASQAESIFLHISGHHCLSYEIRSLSARSSDLQIFGKKYCCLFTIFRLLKNLSLIVPQTFSWYLSSIWHE